MNNNNNPIILCILDGWGIGRKQDAKYDAIKQASLPCWNYLLKEFPHTELVTSGEAVGLPSGQMGNSEVGHMTIGSGRVIFQDLVRINEAIAGGELAKHPDLNKLIAHHLKHNKAVHLFGLCSDGGVHSHIDHLEFLANLLDNQGIRVKLHLFLDGRDVAPRSAEKYLNRFKQGIATISGRFYAMDRDDRLERTQMAYQAIAKAHGNKADNWQVYLKEQYEQNISDEFVVPVILNNYQGIEDGDSLLFTNFRSDRIKQLVHSLLTDKYKLAYKIGMTHYSDELSQQLTCLFSEQRINNSLAEVISKNHKKQLRIAETEKYAHVTFFFNGGKEDLYPNEDRILVPSPKVRTYDLKPEMSAVEVTEKLIEAINSKKYDLIVVNYANGDMVGHSGKIEAAIKAVESIDNCLNQLYQATKQNDGILIITADHGNVECMFDQEHDNFHTAHTNNPVPFIIVKNDLFQSKIKLSPGNLSDVAPTILKIMHIKQPSEMTGKSLI